MNAVLTKEEIERAQLDRFLNRIMPLGYSIAKKINKNERPDFVLEVGQKRIGLEVTQAMIPDYAHAQKIHHKDCPNVPISTTRLTKRDERRPRNKLAQEITEHPWDNWMPFDEKMRDWSEKIWHSLSEKRKRLNEQSFQRFDEDWLLIEDEPGLSNHLADFDYAVRHLNILFAKPVGFPKDFDAIFILSGPFIMRWSNCRLEFGRLETKNEQTALKAAERFFASTPEKLTGLE